MPAVTRGVHVTAPWASTPGNLDGVLATPGLNLIEIDVKDENGEVSGLEARTPALAKRYGAERDYYDLAHVVRLAHDRHIWVVARIVSFKDPIVAEHDKALAIHDASGAIWHDGGGVPWLNQYSPKAWAYLISLGKAAARAGVDEVQYDYVRFPSEGDLSSMRWPHKKAEPKNATIPRFLAAARSALKPFDVKLGVDLFGLAAAHELGIGQDVSLIAKHVDVISPMLYPNHFTQRRARSRRPERQPEHHRRALDGNVPRAADQLAERQDPALAARLRRLPVAAGEGPDQRRHGSGRDRLDAVERIRGLQLERVRHVAGRRSVERQSVRGLRPFRQVAAKLPAWQP